MRITVITTLAFGAITMPYVDATENSDQEGLYVALRGGVDFVRDSDLDASGNGLAFTSGEIELGTGWNAGAAFGYRYGNNIAAEVEYIYRSADVDTVRSGQTSITDGGDLASTAFMLNGYYRFSVRENRWTPYLGLGVGYANEVDIDLDNGAGAGAVDLEDSGFAYQVIAGIDYKISERVSISGDARYFSVPGDVELSAAGNQIDLEYGGFSLQAGISYRF